MQLFGELRNAVEKYFVDIVVEVSGLKMVLRLVLVMQGTCTH